MVYTTAKSKREELRHDKCGDLLKITCVQITYLPAPGVHYLTWSQRKDCVEL